MKYTYAYFEKMKNISLEDKVMWSEQVILKAIKESKLHSVSLSWGKDSIVMLYLIRKFCKGSKVIFANTGCEYPETYKYRDKMLKEELTDMEYFETKPIKTFWQCVKEYGFPHNRQSAEQDIKGEKSKRTPKCCFYLKEKPLGQIEKELEIDTVFIGLQATESMNRRLLFLRLGEYYYKKTNKMNICLPLAIWTDKDIWAYAEKEEIPMNPIYKKMPRNGCMFCTGFANWKAIMAKYNKGIYKMILMKKENQKTIQDCFKKEPEKEEAKS